MKSAGLPPIFIIFGGAPAIPSVRDWKGLHSLAEEFTLERKIVVTLGSHRKETKDGIEIFPVPEFLESLWNGKFFRLLKRQKSSFPQEDANAP